MIDREGWHAAVHEVKKSRRQLVTELKWSIIKEIQLAIFKAEIIHLITMDNNEIRITFNLQRLLDGFEPVPATVIEVRNYIAHPNTLGQ